MQVYCYRTLAAQLHLGWELVDDNRLPERRQ